MTTADTADTAQADPPAPRTGPAHARTGPSWYRRLRVGTRRASMLWLGGASVALLSINIWWLQHFSSGYPLNIDEAEYLNAGFVDANGLSHGGLSGLWNAVQGEHLGAPLAPLLTLPFHLVFGWSLQDAFALSLVLWLALMWLTYALALRLTTPGWALLAALLVGTAPGIINDARDFLFALPLAVMLTGAVWALMCSKGLSRTRWCVVAGIFLGCVPLSRTMGLAYLPAPIAAAVFQAVFQPGLRRRRLLNLAAMAVAGLAAGYWWLHPNLTGILHYLQPPAGKSVPGIGPQRRAHWVVAAHDLVLHELFVPLTVGLLACFVVAACALHLGAPRWSRPTRTWLAQRAVRVAGWGPLIPLATVVAGYAALCLNDQAIGQWIPLIPSLVVLATAALAAIRWATARWAILAYLSLVMVLNTVSQTDTVLALSNNLVVNVPVLGQSPLLDGTSNVVFLMEESVEPSGTLTHPLPAVDRQWMVLAHKEAAFVLAYAAHRGGPAVVTFASRDPLFNTNTLQLAGELWFRQVVGRNQLISNGGLNTVPAMRAQLERIPPGAASFMISLPNSAGGFVPPVDQRLAQKAATSLGFVVIQHFTLPDGRHGTLWWRRPPKT